jgi:hypothetical protein
MVEKILGQGGMAVVYQVLDKLTGKTLALKQLAVTGSIKTHESRAGLFEYEFHTLAQMSHPRIIEVYNYGKDDAVPYYTMELLDGGDLKELAPLPWKRACALMIDACSALGLIHSRRQVHRDLTPRNVRCTRDGKAKLIDFGAMVPMGPNKQVVGTPAFTAPEVVTLQSLDARTDLYSLGATFYYALTGHGAYPCRNFTELHDMWRAKPEPPSGLVAEIPKELDHLMLSLLALDPIARPVNTAEVIEKLSAIAGIEVDDQLLVSQAYLSTPTLVGRADHLVRLRGRIRRALRGHGGTITIESASGVGRSRFLDACVLRGKLSGVTVLRADTTDSRTGNWGAVSAIAAQLVDALPDIALAAIKPHVSILGNILPELLKKVEGGGVRFQRASARSEPKTSSEGETLNADPAAEVWGRGNSWRPPPPDAPDSTSAKIVDDPRELRPRAHAALRDWLLEVSSQRCVMVAVDDIHSIDEPSAAFVALLSKEISRKKILLAVTVETDAPETSAVVMKVLRETGYRVRLANLSATHTEELLGSVFGDAANLRILADRLQAISQGNPRAVMQLTQHLVDKGLIYYRSGAWTLPSRIDTGDLPDSLSEALRARVRRLSADALDLAQTLALSPEQSVSFEEYGFLSSHGETARLIQNLNELVALDILYTDGEYYSFSQQGWVAPLLDQLDKKNQSALHLRLAEMFQKRGTQAFRAVQHLLRADQEERALDAWVDFALRSKELTDQNPDAFAGLLQSLPRDWFESFDAAIRLSQRRGRPRKQIYALQNRLIGMIALTGTGNTEHLSELIAQLAKDSGLECYRELGDSVEAQDRLGRALELTQQRYESSSETEQVLTPFEAIRELARAIIAAIGVVSTSYDFAFWQSLPSLDPLAPLSPALTVVQLLVQALGYRITTRDGQARQKYREILELIAQPDRGGLEETYHKYMRYGVIRGLGMIEAALGLESALQCASEIEVDPSHQVNAWLIRMSFYIWQGNTQEAEQCKQRVELLQIQNSPTQWFEGSHLARLPAAYGLADDLWGVKQTIHGIEQLAPRFPSWVATLHYARGEYQRIRGDYPGALDELGKALKLTAPGCHHNWADIAGAYLRTLLALGRDQDARTLGRELLAAAESNDLGYSCNYLRMPLAVAEAKLGDGARATAIASAAVDEFKGLGATGLNLGLAYETRARLAILMKDYESYKRCAKLCAEQYKTGQNSALAAKYEKLTQEARRGKLGVYGDQRRAGDLNEINNADFFSTMTAIMDGCDGPRERAQYALDTLVKQSKCLGGYLYTVRKDGPVLSAQVGNSPPPPRMLTTVRERIAVEIEKKEDVTATGEEEIESASNYTTEWTGLQDMQYRPLLIGHYTDDGYAITAVAVLILDPSRKFVFPGEMLKTVSRSLLGFGDVELVYVAD